MPRPLANLVALCSPEPGDLRTATLIAEATPGMDEAWTPAPGWVLSARRFAGSTPDPVDAREAGLAFAEGRDLFQQDGPWAGRLAAQLESAEDLAAISGDVGVIALGANGEATLLRSAAGLVPFYVAGEPGRWTVATTLELLIRFHPRELGIDPLINAIWSSGYDAAPERRTFLRDVQAVGRGEYVRLDGSGRGFGRWWRPFERTPEARDDHPQRLRESLIETLERELDPAGDNLLALSGGVDSTAVGALAAGTLGIPVSSLTVLPEDEPSQTRDLSYIQTLADAVEIAPRRVEMVDPHRRLELLDAPAVPFHVLQPYLCLLRSASEKGQVATLFGGEFADHTVGSTLTLRDWSRHTSALELWRARSKLPTGRSDVRNWVTWRLASAVRRPPVPWPDSLPDVIAGGLRDEYRVWVRDRRRRAAQESQAVALPYLRMFTERDGFLGMHWEATSALGIRRCFPFVTREVLELAFECDPAELVAPGTKRLLRAALRNDVPARNLDRPDKGVPGSGAWPALPWAGGASAAVEEVFERGWDSEPELDYWTIFRARQLIAFENSLERVRTDALRIRRELRHR